MEGRTVKKIFQILMTVAAILWLGTAMGTEICVVINLSEQRAYLIEQGRPSLISPIASGKPGWSTPTGSFKILSKDVDHRSGSFGSIINPSGRVINGNATAASRVPAGCHYRPAPMPYYMEFSPGIGMHGGCLPVIQLRMGACGCLEIWLLDSLRASRLARP
jgi:L,D-transpeptidase catalytic domain